MRDRGWTDRLRDMLTVVVALGGAAALAAAVVLGDEDVGLGTLYALLGLILASMGLVLIELGLAISQLARGMALFVRQIRVRRSLERLQRQRRLNSFAVQFGYAAAKGVPIQQAWDEAVARCFPGADGSQAGLAA